MLFSHALVVPLLYSSSYTIKKKSILPGNSKKERAPQKESERGRQREGNCVSLTMQFTGPVSVLCLGFDKT